MDCRHAQDHMDQALRALNFLILGARAQSNWWGLGCPSHCSPSSLPFLTITFLLGLSLELALWHLPRCTHDFKPTCMVEEEAVELALEFQGLSPTVRGPATTAARFAQ